MKAKDSKQAKERMIHVRLPEAMHKKVRIRAAEADETIQDWALQAIKHALERAEGEKRADEVKE